MMTVILKICIEWKRWRKDSNISPVDMSRKCKTVPRLFSEIYSARFLHHRNLSCLMTKWHVRPAKTQISRPVWSMSSPINWLGGCLGWSESSLGAQSFCCFCHEAADLWRQSYYRNSLVLCVMHLVLALLQLWAGAAMLQDYCMHYLITLIHKTHGTKAESP